MSALIDRTLPYLEEFANLFWGMGEAAGPSTGSGRTEEKGQSPTGTVPETFKPYYVAHTKIQTLALLDERYQGPDASRWRTRSQPIRTAAEIVSHIPIKPALRTPLYQRIAPKATELRQLGMPYREVAKVLNVSRNVVLKAYKYRRKASPLPSQRHSRESGNL